MTLIAGVALIVSTADSQSDPAPSSDTNPAILADSASDSTKNAALLAFAEQIGQDVSTNDPLSDPLAAPLANGEFTAAPTADTVDLTVFDRCQTDELGNTVGDCPEQEMTAADLNGDGAVDMRDFRRLLKRAAQQEGQVQ
jgi:hypothetical protein